MRRLFQLGFLIALCWFALRHQDTVAAFLTAPVSLAQHVGSGMELEQIRSALERHRVNYQQYPRPEEFEAFMRSNFRSRGKDVTVDSWDRPYLYRVFDRGRACEVRSLGPDEKDAQDDIIIRCRKE